MGNDKIIQARRPSGFPEYLPQDQIVFNRLLAIIRNTYEQYGFLPIETPAVEFTEILRSNVGEDTQKQIYRLDKTGDDLSLHFDLTVPLARYVAQHYHELTFPFRRYQIQKVWRGERNQRGRFRELYQCDIDVIGSDSLIIDAELPSIIYTIFTQFGFGSFTIRINNRKILSGFLESLDLSQYTADVLRIIDKVEKQGQEATISELTALGFDEEKVRHIWSLMEIKGTNAEVIEQLQRLDIHSELFAQGLQELAFVIKHIALFGVPETAFRVDLTIVRGLDYYTGTVYETNLNDHPDIGSICSGGRYDNLVSNFSDQKLSGVGVSIGFSRLFFLMKELGLVSATKSTLSNVLVTFMDDPQLSYAIGVLTQLRQQGVSAELYLEGDKMKKRFQYADRLSIPYVVVIGEEEIASNQVTLKDMRSGEQAKMDLAEAIKQIQM